MEETTISPEAETPATAAPVAFPHRNARQTDRGVLANKASWGKGWPWKSANVLMACSDAIGGGAYLNAADSKNYLLTGTIEREGFINGNASAELWDQDSTDDLAEWIGAANRLCPGGGIDT